MPSKHTFSEFVENDGDALSVLLFQDVHHESRLSGSFATEKVKMRTQTVSLPKNPVMTVTGIFLLGSTSVGASSSSSMMKIEIEVETRQMFVAVPRGTEEFEQKLAGHVNVQCARWRHDGSTASTEREEEENA